MVEDNALERIVRPVVEGLGFEFWGLEWSVTGKQGFIRVFVDAYDRRITVEDCGLISEQVGAVLDVDEPLSVPYRLEISSPGIERVLFAPWQYERYVGSRVQVRLRAPRDGQRRLHGVIIAVDDKAVQLGTEEGDIWLGYEEIARCRLKYDLA